MSKATWEDTPFYRRLLARLKKDLPSSGGLDGFTATTGADTANTGMAAGATYTGPGGAMVYTGANTADRGYGMVEQRLRLSGGLAAGSEVARVDMYVEDDQAFEDPRDPADEYKEGVIGVRVLADDSTKQSSAVMDAYRAPGSSHSTLSASVSSGTAYASGTLDATMTDAGEGHVQFTLHQSGGNGGQVEASFISNDTQVTIYGSPGQTRPLMRIGQDARMRITANGDLCLSASDGSIYQLVVALDGTLSTIPYAGPN